MNKVTSYRNKIMFIVFCAVVSQIILYIKFHRNEYAEEVIPNAGSRIRNVRDFQNKVKRYAKEGVILVTITDYFFLDLALNLHRSMDMLNMTNYMFVCLHDLACDSLHKNNIQ